MIELQNICFEYGSEEQNIAGRGALHNINLHIPDGQIVLLCGESGCGKTTITRLLNGLIPHFYEGNLTGTICIDGKEINDQPLYETALLSGTVFQNPRSQFFNVDTTSELAFGLENRGISTHSGKNNHGHCWTFRWREDNVVSSDFKILGRKQWKYQSWWGKCKELQCG